MKDVEDMTGADGREVRFLERVLEVARSGLLVWDPQGHLLYSNARGRHIMGRNEQELEGADFNSTDWGITDFEGRAIASDDLPVAKVVNSGQSVREFEHTIQRPDGETRYLCINADPIFDDSNALECVVASVEDVTESFHAQRNLRETQKQFSIAQEAAGFGLWQWRVGEGMSFDRESWRMLGYDADTMPQHMSRERWQSFLHPADREREDLPFEKQGQRNSDTFTVDLRYLTRERQYRWVQLRGRVTGYDAAGAPAVLSGTHVDIHELKESERRFDQIAESITEVFWIQTSDQILYVNPAYERVFGRTRESLYADPKSLIHAIHPQDRRRVVEAFNREQTDRNVFNEEYRIVRTDGQVVWIHAQAYPVAGEPGRLSGIAVDITDRVMAQRALEERATTDPLTGLPTRSVFDKHSASSLSGVRRYGTAASVLVMDVDDFKRVNDTYGHSTGDAVLIEIARRLLASIREGDSAVRWGGEEFAVLLPQTEITGASALAERIRSAIGTEPFETVGRITVSIGVAQMRATDAECVAVFRRADTALYAAKDHGRNRVECGTHNRT